MWLTSDIVTGSARLPRDIEPAVLHEVASAIHRDLLRYKGPRASLHRRLGPYALDTAVDRGRPHCGGRPFYLLYGSMFTACAPS
jgi:hypothetical protein